MTAALQVDGLGKRYHVNRVAGAAPPQHARRADTLVDTIARGTRALGRRLRGATAGTEEHDFWALRDVSFEVAPGEAVGLIGHNGSGKSTLLKILSRVTDPTEGRACLSGRVASLLEVGTGFHPDLSVRQNVFLNGAILGMRRHEIAARLDQIIEFAGLRDFVAEPVKHLSSGMYTRLAFAVAAFLESEILIVDEVLSVGDAAFQEKSIGTMRTAAHSGRTVIFVSHNMAAISQLTQRTIVLEGGRKVFDGPTSAAVQHYLHQHRQTNFRGRQPVDALPCLRRYRGSERFRIQEVGLAGGQPEVIAVGGDAGLEIVVELAEPAEGLRFHYSINAVAGQPILTGLSAAFTAGAGRHLMQLTLHHLDLAPGEYTFSLALGRGSLGEPKLEYDAHLGFGRLGVGTTQIDGGPFGSWPADWAPAVHRTSTVRPLAE